MKPRQVRTFLLVMFSAFLLLITPKIHHALPSSSA
jgi:hypothetical protein